MPDLVGMSTADALYALGEINAMMGTSPRALVQTRGNRAQPRPPAGTTVHPGTFVTVVLASPE